MGDEIDRQCDINVVGVKGWRLPLVLCMCSVKSSSKIQRFSLQDTKKGLDKQVLKRSVIKLFLLNRILSKKYIRTFS